MSIGNRNLRSRRGAIVALAALVLLVTAFSAGAAAKWQRPAYWGASIGDQLTGTEAQWDPTASPLFAEKVGKGLSLAGLSSPFFDCRESPCRPFSFPTREMQTIRDYGAIPFFSWSSAPVGGGVDLAHFELSDLIEGRFDSYIHEFAEESRAWGHPYFLRFNWEMNGGWFPWGAGVNNNGPGEYVEAWRHVHDIFTSVGATNASWVWCPYAREDESVGDFYPGSRYVDWTCLDGFNWGPNGSEPTPWRNFREIFGSAYELISSQVAPHKPMLIGEVASTGNGPAKARWIRNMFTALRTKYHRIRGLVWFDKVDNEMDWPLETSPLTLEAFGAGVQRGFRENVYGDIHASPLEPPVRVRLR